jgi:hypothetical protein
MAQKLYLWARNVRMEWRTTGRFLFADPSFMTGMARVYDLGGLFDDYNYSTTPEEADARAIWSDWVAVGNCLWEAFDQVVAEYPGLGVPEPRQSAPQGQQTQLTLR